MKKGRVQYIKVEQQRKTKVRSKSKTQKTKLRSSSEDEEVRTSLRLPEEMKEGEEAADYDLEVLPFVNRRVLCPRGCPAGSCWS